MVTKTLLRAARVKKLGLLARNVKRLRNAREISQMELAVAAGLSLSVIAQIEQDNRPDPRLSTLKAIADVLEVTVLDLIQEPPPERGKKAKE